MSADRSIDTRAQNDAAGRETDEERAGRMLAEADSWGRIQDRCFKQARSCANDMGLTVSSRCRLVVPESGEKAEESNPFLRLIGGGEARYG